MANELWRWIDGWEGRYEVSSLGNVRSHFTSRGTRRKSPKLLKPWLINTGYPVIGLSNGVYEKRFLVHRLVALAFIANPDGKPCVNHIDSNRNNPHTDNLEWVTRSENQKHAVKHGFLRVPGLKGEKCPSAVLTEVQVRQIRADYVYGSTHSNQRVLARRFNVDQDTINNIVRRLTWKHI